MPRSFLVKKVKHPIDHASRWSYREPSSPSEAEPAHRVRHVHHRHPLTSASVSVTQALRKRMTVAITMFVEKNVLWGLFK
ncbi:hypothetical protein CDAR_107121 [Caerostris darwini]|uniref:Uncharacterized protein n=1 Tax=Caerostris darwini TaxID=1538125 RepID=A0AAV4SZ03_9ARAC|nr:hypothetical protein CDAR_107121 [Caerostris darwini]